MTENENKSLEKFIKTTIHNEVVNRLDLYLAEILKLLNKLNCYFPYLASPQTRALLERDKDKILSFSEERTYKILDEINAKLSLLLNEFTIPEPDYENESVLNLEESEKETEEINKNIVEETDIESPQAEFNWNTEFLLRKDK